VDVLRKVRLRIMAKDECQNKLRGAGASPNFRLHKSSVCAIGTDGENTCKVSG